MYQNNQQVIMINIDDILPNRFQPRLKFNEDEILNLAESIKEHGVIQPIVVRKLGDRYELIAGERRTKASSMAGKTNIPAIVVDLNDNESAEVALIENVQRQDLTSIEEAVSYRKILDMGYLNQSQLAEKVGKKQSTIANKLRLLTLPKEVQTALLESKISERHARSLLRLENEEKQIHMLDRIINERLTVRKTDQEIDKIIDLSKMEVLDIPVVEKKEPKEDENMDNKFNFNDMVIPTTSIIDDKNTLEIKEVAKPIENESGNFNPGFMDIDKIADQAQDIKQDNVILDVAPEQIVPTIPEEPKKEEIPTPKFFNILDNMSSPAPLEQPLVEESKVEPELNTNIFDFSMPKSENTSKVDETSSIQQTKIEESPIINAEQPSILENTQPPFIEEKISPINQDIDDIAIIDDNNFDVEESLNIGVKQEEIVSKPPLREVISKIRELSNIVEGMNYIVDVEEMDFEDIYQVIIKIQK